MTVRVYSSGEIAVVDSTRSALLVIDGEITPELSAENTDMKWKLDGHKAHVSVCSMEDGEKLAGSFLRPTERTLIKSFKLSTYRGSLVQTNPEYVGITP
jgi:hypothetical protein